MTSYTVYQVDAFTRERFRGNPAGVVPQADGLTASQMQAIARELNVSETAFVLAPDAEDHELRIRFFTPTMEVPTCGHATVSAHYVRAVERDLPPGRVWHKIGIGTLPVDVEWVDGDYRIFMTQGSPQVQPPLGTTARAAVLAALGIGEGDVDPRCPVQIVDTGNSKVMVGLSRVGLLHELRPDLNALLRFNEQVPSRGFFVFTLDADKSDVLAHARMFAPQIGINEDPVTGNGNGPLGAYLVHHRLVPHDGAGLSFRARQGEAIGRAGVAHVRVAIEDGRPVRVQVGGDAVIAFKTTIEV